MSLERRNAGMTHTGENLRGRLPGSRLSSLTMSAVLSVSLCHCGSSSVFAQSVPSIIRKGNEQYRAGEFAEALKTYESAAKVDPKSLEAKFNQGVAAYKASDIDLARKLFREVDSAGGNPALASAARYNLGVLETQALRAEPPSDPEKALESLKSAASMFRGSLDLAPQDADAARNLELTRLAIKDLREQIERQKELQRQMQELKEQLKQNQKEQEQASQQNQERASDQQSDQEQKQEAQQQQEQISQQTKQAQQRLDELKEQMGGESGEQDEDQEGDEETPKAQRAGEEPSPQEKLENASESLDEAREKQQKAQERIKQGDLSGAEKEQKEAAEKIKQALEDLAGQQGENQDQQNPEDQQPQSEEEQQAQPEEGQQQEQPPPPEQKEGEQMDQKEGEGESATDARLGRILEKERKDRELKQQVLKKQRARNRPVDKDW